MKQNEIKDIAVGIAYNAPTSVAAWWANLDWTTVIAVILGVLQIAYIVRRWWREETEWGLKLKRMVKGLTTRPAPLE